MTSRGALAQWCLTLFPSCPDSMPRFSRKIFHFTTAMALLQNAGTLHCNSRFGNCHKFYMTFFPNTDVSTTVRSGHHNHVAQTSEMFVLCSLHVWQELFTVPGHI